MDNQHKSQRKVIWFPSSAPDLGERRLCDRLNSFAPLICRTEKQATDAIRSQGASVVVANGPADGWQADTLFAALQNECPGISFFLRDNALPTSLVVHMVRRGAAGVFGREADIQVLALAIESALGGSTTAREPWRHYLIGTSAAMERLCSLVRLVSERRGTVLLNGESGSGKEVLARAIHSAGNRSAQPFVAVNCGAIPDALLEAELFGHVRGAFTGAHAPRVGRFEQAQGGSIFLDEIGDLNLELQGKLLRVLQEREIQRLGSSETIRLDVRIIAATHVDIARRIREGAFREDLYYRLNVIPIEIPPLRERKSDIPQLAEHFIRKICALESIPIRDLTHAVRMRLMECSWPGNIRQLENAIERAIALSGSRILLDEADFDLPSEALPSDSSSDIELPDGAFDFERAVNHFEWNLLSQALRKAGGNKKAAAEMLGLKRTTLAAKVKVLSTTSAYTVM